MNKLVTIKNSEFYHSIEKTFSTFKSSGDSILSSAVQEEMSKSIALFRKVDKCLNVANYKKNQIKKEELEAIECNLNLAINLLLKNPPNLILAKKLRRDAEFTIRKFNNPIMGRLINGFKYVLYESDTAIKVLFGLGLAIPIYLIVPCLPYNNMVQHFTKPILSENQHTVLSQNVAASTSKAQETSRISQYDVDKTIALLVLVGIAGSLGSIVSILTRIKEYENEKYTDSLLPIVIGAFKPLIGGIFGIFLFTLLSSGFLPLEIKSDPNRPINEWYGFFALAFIAGFSERLVQDIISQTEKRVSPTSTTTPTSAQVEEQKVSSIETANLSTSAQVEEQKVSSIETANLSTSAQVEEQKD